MDSNPLSTEQFTIDYGTKIKAVLEEFLHRIFDNHILRMSVAFFRSDRKLHAIPYVHVGISPDADIEGLEFPHKIGAAAFGPPATE
jgi:hypothetical protein